MSDSNSVITDLSDEEEHIADMVANERMYYVLSQFLETDDNKTVAKALCDIADELGAIRKVLESFVSLQTKKKEAPSS